MLQVHNEVPNNVPSGYIDEIPIDRQWAIGMTEEDFYHSYIRRFQADNVPTLGEYLKPSRRIKFPTMDELNEIGKAETLKAKEISPIVEITPISETPKNQTNICKFCGKEFNYENKVALRLVKARHEKKCKGNKGK